MSKGFTIIELLVVTAIVGLFSAAVLPNYNNSAKRLALERAAHKVAQDLRRAQEMAISSYEIGGSIPDGVGLFFAWPDRYVLFADRNDDHKRSSNEDLETIPFESGVSKILLSYNDTWTLQFGILFEPPDPTVWIKERSSSTVGKITLALTSDTSVKKDVFINNTGLIYVGE